MVKPKKVKEIEEPKEAMRSPTKKWEAAILNLSGMGLGYIHLQQWGRWGIHLGVTLILLVIATLLKASQMPWLWILLWLLWVGWMTIDGWLQGSRVIRTKDRIIRSTIISLRVIVFGIVIWVISYLICTSLFNDGSKAFKNNDYETTLSKLNLVSNAFQLTFSPSIKKAEAMRNQSALLIFGHDSLVDSNFEDAESAYTSLINLYPDSVKVNEADNQLAVVYHQWATFLYQEEDFAEAESKYKVLFTHYPDSTEIEKSRQELGDMYIEWAQSLRQAGDFDTAVQKYLTVQESYPDVVTSATLVEQLFNTYFEWAEVLNGLGDFETAQQKYELAIGDYASSPIADTVYDKAAANLFAWGEQLYHEGKIESAIDVLIRILDFYPGSPAVTEAEQILPDAMLNLVTTSNESIDYKVNVLTIQQMIRYFPDDEQTLQARASLSPTLIHWGQELAINNRYLMALEKYTLAKQESMSADSLSDAEEQYQAALISLANDTGDDGQAVIRQAKSDACAGVKTKAPGIGIFTDQPGSLVMCDYTYLNNYVGEPKIPGTFRYVAEVKKSTDDIQFCPYSGHHLMIRRQNKILLTLTSTITGQVVRTQTFTGSAPEPCTSSRSFGSTIDFVEGGPVETEAIIDWLNEFLGY